MRRVVVSTSLVLALAACQAEAPPVQDFDMGVADPSALRVQPRDDCPQVDPTSYITRVDAPATTNAQTQAIRGVAVEAGDVLARTSDGVIQSLGRASADGRFCVETNLVANTQNRIELIPRLPDGCWGQPRTVLITHQFTAGNPTGPAPSPIFEPQNVALGKSVYSPYVSGTSGGGAMAATDGYTDSYAELSRWDVLGNQSVWLRLDLGTTQSISEFRIDWDPGSTDHWATHYSILTSVAPDPADPTAHSASDWTPAIDVPNAGWGTQRLRVSGVSARWVALVLHSDDAYIKDTFRLAEFGVYSSTNQNIPVGGTHADTCP